MGSRHASRELALQYLFSREFQNSDAAQKSAIGPVEWLEKYARDFALEDDVKDFALELAKGVLENKSQIDQLIQSHSAHWKLGRMALVDLNILRIALFEMKWAQELQPPKVVMNEAIELAKKFGTMESSSFVNGIIDPVAKTLLS